MYHSKQILRHTPYQPQAKVPQIRRRTTENTAGTLPYLLHKKPQAYYGIYYRQRYHIYHHHNPPDQMVGDATEDGCFNRARPKDGSSNPYHITNSVIGCGLNCPPTGRRRCSGWRTYQLFDAWVYTMSDDVSCTGTSTTLRGRAYGLLRKRKPRSLLREEALYLKR